MIVRQFCNLTNDLPQGIQALHVPAIELPLATRMSVWPCWVHNFERQLLVTSFQECNGFGIGESRGHLSLLESDFQRDAFLVTKEERNLQGRL